MPPYAVATQAVTTVDASGDRRLDGLLEGVKWAGPITYTNPDRSSDYPAAHPEALTDFRPLNDRQLAAVHAALSDAPLGQPPGSGRSRSPGSPRCPSPSPEPARAKARSGWRTPRTRRRPIPIRRRTATREATSSSAGPARPRSPATTIITPSSTSSAMRSASSTATRATASARCRRQPTRWNTR